MTLAVYRQLTHLGVQLHSKDGRLKWKAPAGVMTDELLQEIRANKTELLELLIIKEVSREGSLTLSYAQERLWVLSQLGYGAQYQVPKAVKINGKLCLEVLQNSLDFMLARHESLRTGFTTIAGEPVQVIAKTGTLTLEKWDLSNLDPNRQNREVQEQIREFCRRPFQLEEPPLMRVGVFALGERCHILVFCMHHIISDAWSMGIFVREMSHAFAAFSRGEQPKLKALTLQYADYAQWQRRVFTSEALDREISYWQKRLKGFQDLDMSTDLPRPKQLSGKGGQEHFRLEAEDAQALRNHCRTKQVTLFAALSSAVYILLQRYSQQSDICIGTPVANRNRRELETLIGFFVNTLVLRINQQEIRSTNLETLLEQTHQHLIEAQDHQNVPFEKVVEHLQPRRDLSRTPLFQVLINYINTKKESFQFGDAAVENVALDYGISKFDLSFGFADREHQTLAITIEYSRDLYLRDTVLRMGAHLITLLRCMVSHPNGLVERIELWSPQDKQTLLTQWNLTESSFPTDKTVPDLFEAQVLKTPQDTAITFGKEQLTYRELNQKADQMALHLQHLGVGPNQLVAVCMQRGLEMMVALVGVLKSGAAFVPIDPGYPRARIQHVLEDSLVKTILTQARIAPVFDNLQPVKHGKTVLVDAQWTKIESSQGTLDQARQAAHLAYVIYTSGSTGRPKGVMVQHRNVVNFFTAMDQVFGEQDRGKLLAVTSISFDISVLELFWTLVRGFEVVIPRDQDSHYCSFSGSPTGSKNRDMDFSLFYFADADQDQNSDKYRLLLEGAKFGDQNGFAAVWTPERHFHNFGGLYPNPSVTGAAVAAITEKVAVRAGSVVLPLHNPIRVAEEWSVVDNISGGRVGLSIASGWHPNDFALAPKAYTERKTLMFRELEQLQKLWRGESVVVANGLGKQVPIQIFPKPVQRELPIWVTAAGNPETFRMAGEMGANLLTHLLGQTIEDLRQKIAVYQKAWQAREGAQGQGRVTLMLHTFVGEDREEVYRQVRQPFITYLEGAADLGNALLRNFGDQVQIEGLSEADRRAMLARAFDRYVETSGLFGTPESCAEWVHQLKTVGVDEIACLIDFGVDPETVLKNLPFLAKLKKNPHFQMPLDPALDSLTDHIRRHEITHLQCTPSMARMLTVNPDVRGELQSLKTLMLGGEALPMPLVKQLEPLTSARIYNMYGPTETTIWSTVFGLQADTKQPLIGRPIANTKTYIVNAGMNLQPIGAAGELLIGGAGVVRGYHRRQGQTAARFVPDPFSDQPGSVLYRTGDLAKWHADGHIEFLGRIDQQVKVRGHRIELPEIETVLSHHPEIERSVAVTHKVNENADAQLVAYVVPKRKDCIELNWNISGSEKAELLAGKTCYRWPNSLEIVNFDGRQTNALYGEVFEAEIYTQHGITIEDGDCIFDVGANIGAFTLFAHQKGTHLKVFAFEPITPTFELLKTNMALYGLDVNLFNLGLSAESGTASFTFYPNFSGLSGKFTDSGGEKQVARSILGGSRNKSSRESAQAVLSKPELDSFIDDRLRSERHECSLETLSNIIAEYQIEGIDLLKIDVEKSEVDVLRGIHGEDWKKIRQIVMEIHSPALLAEVKHLLEEHNFEMTVDSFTSIQGVEDGADLNVYMLYGHNRTMASRPTEKKEGPWKPKLDQNRLQAYLRRQLPAYMVPSNIVFLSEIPMTPNGKIDRKSLGERELERPSGKEYKAPATDTQKRLAEVWKEVLGIERVGLNDDFFELGGHSLRAIRMVARIRERLGVQCPVKNIFEYPTIDALSNILSIPVSQAPPQQLDEDAIPKREVQPKGSIPLATTQLIHWLMWLVKKDTINLHRICDIRGPFNRGLLEKTFHILLQRHEAVRTRFSSWSPVQKITPFREQPIRYLDLHETAPAQMQQQIEKTIAEVIYTAFDIARPPLLRLCLIKKAEDHHLLVLAAPHIAGDNTGFQSLFEELVSLYGALVSDRPLPPAKTALRLADFVYWQHETSKRVFKNDLEYWRRKMRGALLLAMPESYFLKPGETAQPHQVTLKSSSIDLLAKISQDQKVSMQMSLSAIIALTLNRISSQKDLCITTLFENRVQRELEHLLTPMDTPIPIRIQLEDGGSFPNLVAQVKQTILDAYDHVRSPWTIPMYFLSRTRRRDHSGFWVNGQESMFRFFTWALTRFAFPRETYPNLFYAVQMAYNNIAASKSKPKSTAAQSHGLLTDPKDGVEVNINVMPEFYATAEDPKNSDGPLRFKLRSPPARRSSKQGLEAEQANLLFFVFSKDNGGNPLLRLRGMKFNAGAHEQIGTIFCEVLEEVVQVSRHHSKPQAPPGKPIAEP